MHRLWVRSLVAIVVMDLLFAGAAAASVAAGFSSGREFGGAVGTGIFVAFIAIGYCAGALVGAILPAALLIRRAGWELTGKQALGVGACLAVPALMADIVGAWLLDGADISLLAYVTNAMRFPRALMLLPVFAVGGAIVVSGLARPIDRRRALPSRFQAAQSEPAKEKDSPASRRGPRSLCTFVVFVLRERGHA